MEETQTGQVSRQVVQLGERKLELTLLEGDILHITYPECLQPKLIAVPAPVTKEEVIIGSKRKRSQEMTQREEGTKQKKRRTKDPEKGLEEEEKGKSVEDEDPDLPEILRLPVEIQHILFSYLPINTAAILNLVCKQFKSVTDDETFWHHIYKKRFGCPRLVEVGWKLKCIAMQRRSDSYDSQLRPPIGARAQKTLWAVRNGLFEYFERIAAETTDRRIVPLQEVIDAVAAEPRLSPIIDILIKYKYDILAVDDSDGWKAIHQAAKQGNTPMVSSLITHGANLNDHGNAHLVTPLTLAAEYGHLDTVKFLLSIGANPNIQDNQQDTALIFAAEYGHEGIVEKLLEVPKLNVNAQNVNGQTALIQAARSGNKTIIEMLLARGADPTISSHDGMTALTVLSTELPPTTFAELQELLKQRMEHMASTRET